MTANQWQVVSGVLLRGHQVASRPSKDYPYGSLEKQKPYFKALGLDLYEYFTGTLNVSIKPHVFELTRPQFTFSHVEWTDLHPPETFSFSRCKTYFADREYEGWVYYPHPETKKTHFQEPSLVEIITYPIPGITYGDFLEIGLNASEITLK